jgi:hypothetical protein
MNVSEYVKLWPQLFDLPGEFLATQMSTDRRLVQNT